LSEFPIAAPINAGGSPPTASPKSPSPAQEPIPVQAPSNNQISAAEPLMISQLLLVGFIMFQFIF
jgi:hypothetical protein